MRSLFINCIKILIFTELKNGEGKKIIKNGNRKIGTDNKKYEQNWHRIDICCKETYLISVDTKYDYATNN